MTVVTVYSPSHERVAHKACESYADAIAFTRIYFAADMVVTRVPFFSRLPPVKTAWLVGQLDSPGNIGVNQVTEAS